MNIIYKIENKVRAKVYIGRGDAKQRRSNHFSSLKSYTHHSGLMKMDYVIDGKLSFDFEVIACPIKPEFIEELEDIIIDQYDAMNPILGYNRSNSKGRSPASKFETSERHYRGKYCFLPGVKISDPVSHILYSTYQSSLHTQLVMDLIIRNKYIKK